MTERIKIFSHNDLDGFGAPYLLQAVQETVFPDTTFDIDNIGAGRIDEYFDQDLIWDDPTKTPLQTIQDQFPTMLPKTIRQRLAKAGINAANAQKPMNLLSGGEQTKVKLALLELTPSNFLILDEPTNHLDDETKEGLKRALQNFPGNLILVSHEQSFTNGWLDKVLNVEKLSLKK